MLFLLLCAALLQVTLQHCTVADDQAGDFACMYAGDSSSVSIRWADTWQDSIVWCKECGMLCTYIMLGVGQCVLVGTTGANLFDWHPPDEPLLAVTLSAVVCHTTCENSSFVYMSVMRRHVLQQNILHAIRLLNTTAHCCQRRHWPPAATAPSLVTMPAMRGRLQHTVLLLSS